MSNTFEFEEESDREFQEFQQHEFQEQEFQESEWEAEYGRRRWTPRMARRMPARPFRPVKRPFAIKRPFAVRPRRPGGLRYVPIFPVIPWSAGPADEPPIAPASAPFADPATDATTDTTWPGDASPQDASNTASAPGDAAPPDEPPPAEPASTDQPQGESSRVRWSQDALNRAFGLELEMSGVLNAPTRSAIRTLQRQAGLPAHGQLDRATASALRQRAGSASASDASMASASMNKASCGCASCRAQAGRQAGS
jgi:putative peptidoglycan binding protein